MEKIEKFTPSVRTINYTPPKVETYESTQVSYDFNSKLKIFDSGDFVLDWYNSVKYIQKLQFREFETEDSKTINEFIINGAPFKPMYCNQKSLDDGTLTSILTDKMENNNHTFGNILFFVEEGTTPTWEELREICKDKKI